MKVFTKGFFSALLCVISLFPCFAQNRNSQNRNTQNKNTILTAADFFATVSENYSKINDYEADVSIETSTSTMIGHVSFKRPSMIRIDFEDPESQVILYNGTELIIYLPRSQAILRQTISKDKKDDGAAPANVSHPNGLALLSRYYSVAYETSPNEELLDSENPKSEKVIRLLFERKNNSETFKRINIAISPKTKLIRTVNATTINNENFAISFTEYAINQQIPDTRFLYDTPPTANEYNNFLFAE